jgi:WD40 repeat protein
MIPLVNFFYSMTRNPKFNRLASSSNDGTIRIWDTVTRYTSITMSQHISAVTCIRWGGDGLLYSSSRDKTIKIWDTTKVPTIYFSFILTNSLLFIKGKERWKVTVIG